MRSISQKILSGVIVAGMMVSTSFATQVGTGTVTGSGGLTTPVNWNDTFTAGAASGSVNGLYVKARVKPILNMVISGSGVIDLGELDSAAYSSGSVNIELGTNAVNGASVTARSTNAGLNNSSSGSIQINDLTADQVQDSYKFASALVAADDSSYTSFAHTAALDTEVNSTANHTLYSSNRPQALLGTDDFAFVVSAQPSVETPAGEYSDVVVVTITGNF